MVKLKKRKLPEAEIPTSSMADISFLLLLFFLVSTVIDVDTGIGIVLPEYVEDQTTVPISKDRMAAVLVNENGDVLLNNEIIAVPQIAKTLKPRIESKINLPANKKLVVSVKTDRKTNYNLYIQTLDQVKEAYSEVRDEYARTKFGKRLIDLDEKSKEMEEIKEKIPFSVSIAEPESIKK